MCTQPYMLVCLWPYTVNFNVHINISRKLNVLMRLVGQCWATASGNCRMASYFFVTAATDRPSTAGCSLTVQNHRCWVEIVSGKGRAKMTLINASNSVHHFSVKLSLFMCMLAAAQARPRNVLHFLVLHVTGHKYVSSKCHLESLSQIVI